MVNNRAIENGTRLHFVSRIDHLTASFAWLNNNRARSGNLQFNGNALGRS